MSADDENNKVKNVIKPDESLYNINIQIITTY